MTFWPEPEKTKIPEGHYQFRLNKEPELRAFTYKDRNGNQKEGRKLVVFAIGIGDQGEFSVVDAFMPWEDRYKELCKALGVEHGKDITIAGAIFEADIKHAPDKLDPLKSWPRIVNITPAGQPKGDTTETPEEGDDIPF